MRGHQHIRVIRTRGTRVLHWRRTLMSRLRSTPWSPVVALLAAVLCLGGFAELVAGPWRHISQAFFITCAAAGPLLAIAVFRETPLVMNPVIHAEGLTSANEMTVRALTLINVAMSVTVEAFALYAIATHASSAFLVVCCVLPWLVQLSLMVQIVYYRTGVSRVGPG